MSKNHTTKISSSGLRYKSKELGSPFGESVGVATMSCYKCGVHKSRAKGSFKKIIGQRMFICGECKPVV
jgi:hypothetical protein